MWLYLAVTASAATTALAARDVEKSMNIWTWPFVAFLVLFSSVRFQISHKKERKYEFVIDSLSICWLPRKRRWEINIYLDLALPWPLISYDVHFAWLFWCHMRSAVKPNCSDEIGNKKEVAINIEKPSKLQFVADIKSILNLHKSSRWPKFGVIQSVLFILNATFACQVFHSRLSF